LELDKEMRIYDTFSPDIYFTTVVYRSGKPENGLNIIVSVIDLLDNSEILSQAMPEIGATGYYKTLWQPTFTEKKNLFARVYVDDGNKQKILGTVDIIVNNNRFLLEEKIDENDGLAI